MPSPRGAGGLLRSVTGAPDCGPKLVIENNLELVPFFLVLEETERRLFQELYTRTLCPF
jgi:hypothetical protein